MTDWLSAQIMTHAALIRNMAGAHTDEPCLIIIDSVERRLLFNSIVGSPLRGLIEFAPQSLKRLLTRGVEVLREGSCLVLLEAGEQSKLYTFDPEREVLRPVSLRKLN